MKIKKHWHSLKNNQSGIASMVIVILIMTLLTLVVLAMTQNSNREQREAVDRQLSSQAFYAAESGVSDAKDFIASPPVGVFPPLKKSNCNGVAGADDGDQFPSKVSQIGDFENTKYTCVLYNRTPTDLKYSNIDIDTSTIVPIEDQGRVPIRNLTFSWTKEDGGSSFGGCPGNSVNLPKELPADCEAGLLRIELVDPSSPNRQQLIKNTFLSYVMPVKPSASTSSLSYGSSSGDVSKQGSVSNARCDSSGGCSITISSINKDKLYLNLRSIYKSNKVTVTGQRADGGEIRFRNAQMEVDSTGQANDILKRVQVRIDLSGLNSSFVPEFVLQTSIDICKRLQIQPDGVTDECPVP